MQLTWLRGSRYLSAVSWSQRQRELVWALRMSPCPTSDSAHSTWKEGGRGSCGHEQQAAPQHAPLCWTRGQLLMGLERCISSVFDSINSKCKVCNTYKIRLRQGWKELKCILTKAPTSKFVSTKGRDLCWLQYRHYYSISGPRLFCSW